MIQLFDVLYINSTFSLISMCYMWLFFIIVLAFCISMLTLAKFKASHLLDGLVSLLVPGSHEEAGKNLVPIDICLLFWSSPVNYRKTDSL